MVQLARAGTFRGKMDVCLKLGDTGTQPELDITEKGVSLLVAIDSNIEDVIRLHSPEIPTTAAERIMEFWNNYSDDFEYTISGENLFEIRFRAS